MKIGHKKDENHCRGVSTHPLFPRFFLLLEEKIEGKANDGWGTCLWSLSL